MGLGQKFLTRVGSGQFFVAQVGFGFGFEFGNFPPKNVKFFNFFPFGSKKISLGQVGKYFGLELCSDLQLSIFTALSPAQIYSPN